MLAWPCSLGGSGHNACGAGGASREGSRSLPAVSTDIAHGTGENMDGNLGAVCKASMWLGCIVGIELSPRLPRNCHRLFFVVPMLGASADHLAS